ncbi:hypothetical protein [Actinoplanes sp. NPDC089786]|uniref:hypothetical protein n=1 Tax=Actinoplanes sp. NPDC089786 TaxID=3155185 RepID=UPI00341692A9
MNSADQHRPGEVHRLRELAFAGRLASAALAATPVQYAALSAAAYELAWPLVFHRITRPVERRRGHWRCASAMTRLADECVDGFHDDVEAVVADLLHNAKARIISLEAWLTGRLTASTVDGHRRRRGLRGAQQRPRLPKWLDAALGGDKWLGTLAVRMLEWAGVPETAGAGTWPLDSWAAFRAEVTGDWAGSDPRTVLADVHRVQAAMRRRPGWYADYIERPLGGKIAPVASPPEDAAGEVNPLVAMTPEDRADDVLVAIAAGAVDAIAAGLGGGEDPEALVVRVVNAAFGAGSGSDQLDRRPGGADASDELVSALLADPAARGRIVATAIGIVCGE